MEPERDAAEIPDVAADVAAPAPAFGMPGPSAAPGLGHGSLATGYLASLARRPAAQRAQVMRALSAGGGNRAVSALVARSVVNEVMEFKHGIDIDLSDATDDEKLDWIRKNRSNHGGVEYVWESFADPLAIARANAELFQSCAASNPTLLEMDAFDPIREEFKTAVEDRVRANLNSNRNYVADEMAKLGVLTEGREPGIDADEHLRKTQLLAEKVSAWQQAMDRARKIKVGHRTVTKSSGARADFTREVEETQYFNPEQPPERGEPPKNADPSEFHDYADVKRDYDTLERGVKRVFAESPAVFATVQQGQGFFDDAGKAAGDLAKASPDEARKQLREVLGTLVSKIEEAESLIGDDIDHRDFIPVHQQLFKQAPFNGELEKAVIEEEIKDHEFGKVLSSLALGTVAAAGFLVAEFATAGMATFIGVAVGVGAGAAQAGMSIEDYLDKAAAFEARSGDASKDIMSEEQVDSALFQAILDTAMFALDAAAGIVGAAAKLRGAEALLAKAGEAGMEAATGSRLVDALAGADDAAKAAALEASMTEVGIEGTLKATGKTAEELAKEVGENTPAGKRLLAAAELGKEAGAVEGLLEKLATFASLEKTEKEAVIRASFEQFGYTGTLRKVPGGWKGVTQAFGKGHAIAEELEAWRSQLVEEMKQWLEATSKGESKAVRTGTERSTSDVDVSTVGADAAQNVERAKEFIAQRAGCSREELEALLDLDAAVNPARMHLQDVVKGLSPEARAQIEREAARFEEGLSYNRRYHGAKQAGDEELMRQIEAEAGSRLNREWVPLDKGQITALERQMDDWSKRLAELEAAGGAEAEKAELIRNIGRTQAQVLASNENMYGAGGAIRKWVTERPAAEGAKSDLEKLAEAGVRIDPAAKEIWPGQRFTAILAEGHFLDKSFRGIRTGKGSQLVKAIKDFGKHGGRVVEVLGRDITVTGLSAKVMDDLAEELKAWVDLAASGALADQVRHADKLAEIQAKLAGQMANFKTAMANGTGAIRAQAQLGEAMGAAELDGIAAWTAAQAAAEQRAQAILDSLLEMAAEARAAATAGELAYPESTPDAEEPNASYPSDEDADEAASRL